MEKANAVPKDIDEYLAGVPEPARGTLQKIRAMIRSAAPPEATEAISYRIPTFKYQGPLMAFAALPSTFGALKQRRKFLSTPLHYPGGDVRLGMKNVLRV